MAPRFVDQRPVEPPRATSKESAYWVQVGAFSSTARAEKALLGLQDFPVSLMIAPGDALMRVRVGPFANREAAAAKLREIRTRGYESAYIFDPNR